MVDIKNTGYDLILMDIKLPGIDGFETTEKIRKILPKIPIIAQTALYIPSELEKFKQFGFDGVLFKPFPQEDLLGKIHNCLNKQKTSLNHIKQN
jgi:CheY-like chemotaxis protein